MIHVEVNGLEVGSAMSLLVSSKYFRSEYNDNKIRLMTKN